MTLVQTRPLALFLCYISAVPQVRVEKKKRNPKYRPYGKDSRLSGDSAMPFYSLMRWPVLLFGIGLVLIVLLMLPPPIEWVDRILDYEFTEEIYVPPNVE